MFILIAIILLFIAVYQFIVGRQNSSLEAENEAIGLKNDLNKGHRESDPHNAWRVREDKPLKKPYFSFKYSYKIFLLSSVISFIMTGVFFINPAGTITSVQYLWGGDKMVSTQGLKVRLGGKTIQMSYEISLKDIIRVSDPETGKLYSLPGNSSGIYNRDAKKWEFSDAIKADIGTAVVIEIITEDEETFLKMADRNRSEAKLIYGRVLPNIDAALKNTCKLMDAQDYISGAAADFDRFFRDQLENGMYLVEEYYEKEEIPEIIGDTLTVRTIGTSGKSASKQKKFKIKRDSQGNILRDNTSNSMRQYGIRFVQAQVTNIDWENSFDDRLDRQKEEVALTQLEKQEAERQYYTAKKEAAKAEANKAKRRGELEVEQVEQTIAAETMAKAAKFKEEEENNLLNAAEKTAKKIKLLADAEAYQNQRLVNAGLTPQERKSQEEIMNRDKWINLSKMKFDGTYIMGSTGKGGSEGLLSSLLGAQVARDMNKK